MAITRFNAHALNDFLMISWGSAAQDLRTHLTVFRLKGRFGFPVALNKCIPLHIEMNPRLKVELRTTIFDHFSYIPKGKIFIHAFDDKVTIQRDLYSLCKVSTSCFVPLKAFSFVPLAFVLWQTDILTFSNTISSILLSHPSQLLIVGCNNSS